jgi:hypothetical protein
MGWRPGHERYHGSHRYERDGRQHDRGARMRSGPDCRNTSGTPTG